MAVYFRVQELLLLMDGLTGRYTSKSSYGEVGGGDHRCCGFLRNIVDLQTGEALGFFGIDASDTFTEFEPKQFAGEYNEALLQEWLGANPDRILDEKLLVVGRGFVPISEVASTFSPWIGTVMWWSSS